jgi:hypothetical protein
VPRAAKPRKVGRPKMPKGQTKGHIVPVRFSAQEVERISAAASAKNQKISEWIRSAINVSLG